MLKLAVEDTNEAVMNLPALVTGETIGFVKLPVDVIEPSVEDVVSATAVDESIGSIHDLQPFSSGIG